MKKINKEKEYEDKILNFLGNKPEGWSANIKDLTDTPDKLVAAIKKLMDEGYLKYLNFSNDYKRILK